MSVFGGTSFHFGNMGTCLIEKVERMEMCQVCGESIRVGEEVWEYGCNHVVHCSCRGHDVTRMCEVDRHMLDDRYTIHTIVQRHSDLRKKLRGARLFEVAQAKERAANRKGKASLKDYYKFPKIPLAVVNRLLGVGTSTAAPPQEVHPPPMLSTYVHYAMRHFGAIGLYSTIGDVTPLSVSNALTRTLWYALFVEHLTEMKWRGWIITSS